MGGTLRIVMLFLIPGVTAIAQQTRPASTADPRREAAQAIADSLARLPELEAVNASMVQSNSELSRMYAALSHKIADAQRLAEGNPTSAQDQLKQLQEMTTTFNVQYVRLQEKMQQLSQQFSVLSNIMKTKHDTAKNAIGNIR